MTLLGDHGHHYGFTVVANFRALIYRLLCGIDVGGTRLLGPFIDTMFLDEGNGH
jgi:hypothetical protein